MSSTSTEAGHASLIRTAIHHFSTSRKFVQSGRELTRLPAALSLPYPSTTLNVTAKRLCMFAHVCVRTTIYPSIYLRSGTLSPRGKPEVLLECANRAQLIKLGLLRLQWMLVVQEEKGEGGGEGEEESFCRSLNCNHRISYSQNGSTSKINSETALVANDCSLLFTPSPSLSLSLHVLLEKETFPIYAKQNVW